jgi:hypothetical protein
MLDNRKRVHLLDGKVEKTMHSSEEEKTMQAKQHTDKQKQADTSSAQHVISHTRPEQSMQHEPTAAHAYQRLSSGQLQTYSPAEMLSLQHNIGNQAIQRLLHPSLSSPIIHQPTASSEHLKEGPISERLQATRNAEQSLDKQTQHTLEPALGTDLSQIPVPTDQADQLAHSVDAVAFSGGNSAHQPLLPDPVTLPPKKNTTGLPDTLKAGVESLSGISMNDVNVHYNSSKPAEVQALTYTQGTEIHVGPGQERHIAHEAWHVVQQKLGRVKPTLQVKGIAINDNAELEREADRMGTHVAQEPGDLNHRPDLLTASQTRPTTLTPIQRKLTFEGQKQFTGIGHLKASLKEKHLDHHDEIDRLVDEAESQTGRLIPAVYTFHYIIRIGEAKGWERVVPSSSSSSHGPQLPRMNAAQTDKDWQSAMSIMFSSVTFARAELTLPSGKVAIFEARHKSGTVHAENILIGQINAYLVSNKKVKSQECKLKITINNAPCGKGIKERDCAQILSNYMGEKKF